MFFGVCSLLITGRLGKAARKRSEDSAKEEARAISEAVAGATGSGRGRLGGDSEAIRAEHSENVARASAQGTILNRHTREPTMRRRMRRMPACSRAVKVSPLPLTFQDSGSPNHASPQLPRASLVDFSTKGCRNHRIHTWRASFVPGPSQTDSAQSYMNDEPGILSHS